MRLLTERCVELLGATDGGLMLASASEELRPVASSSEQMRKLELLEVQSSEGPCLDAFRTATAVGADDIDAVAQRWPGFSAHVRRAGYRSIYAVPMRLRSRVIGALNLFNTNQAPWDEDDLELAQALADVATIGFLHYQALHDSQMLTTQLQGALDSRVAIEQAKGLLAGRVGITTADAFERLRQYARSQNLRLSQVAAELVDGTLPDSVIRDVPPRNR
ncbi:MAG: GAF and ANTAR domain-containing protein [Acidimicrobiales bacterium]